MKRAIELEASACSINFLLSAFAVQLFVLSYISSKSKTTAKFVME